MATEAGCDTPVEPYQMGMVHVTRCPMRMMADDPRSMDLAMDVLRVIDVASMAYRDPTPRTVDALQTVMDFRSWYQSEELRQRSKGGQ